MAQLQDTSINDTGFITLPSGNTAQRPTPTAGMIRLNTSNNILEFYDSAGWRPITGISKGAIGTGGQQIIYSPSNNSNRANGVVHIFTTAGSHTFTPAFTGTVEVLVVGGGGSGGAHLGAGGGAGGVIYNRSFPVSSGTGIPVTVAGTASAPPNYAQSSTNGGNSVFGSITANGGGGGGSWNGYAGRPGGSGGGGCPGSNGAGSNGHTGPNNSRNTNMGGRGIQGQGFPGGSGIRFNRQGEDSHKAGGGGGAGGPGHSAEDDKDQGLLAHGGPGIMNDIMGYTLYWGGGGGGAVHHGNSTVAPSGGIGGGGGGTQTHAGPNYGPTAAGQYGPTGVGGGMALNTGGSGASHFTGGDGGANTGAGGSGAHGNPGDGGSGIVIVRY